MSWNPAGVPVPPPRLQQSDEKAGRLRTLRPAAVLTVAGLTLSAMFVAAGFVLLLFEFWLVRRVQRGVAVRPGVWERLDTMIITAGYVSLGVVALVGVAFVTWLHRAYRNLDVIAPGTRRFRPGWAVGGWFVPILQLWRPKQVVNDVWRGSSGSGKVSPGVHAWWALWLAGLVGGRVVYRLDGETVEEYRRLLQAEAALSVIEVLAATLLIVIVLELTRRQEAAAGALRPGDPSRRAGGAPRRRTGSSPPGPSPAADPGVV